jgi:hypothetical protein
MEPRNEERGTTGNWTLQIRNTTVVRSSQLVAGWGELPNGVDRVISRDEILRTSRWLIPKVWTREIIKKLRTAPHRGWNLSKFRDFSENRAFLFPSELVTIAEGGSRRGKQLDFNPDARVLWLEFSVTKRYFYRDTETVRQILLDFWYRPPNRPLWWSSIAENCKKCPFRVFDQRPFTMSGVRHASNWDVGSRREILIIVLSFLHFENLYNKTCLLVKTRSFFRRSERFHFLKTPLFHSPSHSEASVVRQKGLNRALRMTIPLWAGSPSIISISSQIDSGVVSTFLCSSAS